MPIYMCTYLLLSPGPRDSDLAIYCLVNVGLIKSQTWLNGGGDPLPPNAVSTCAIDAAPAESPIAVKRLLSPPNKLMYLDIQSMEARTSRNPKFAEMSPFVGASQPNAPSLFFVFFL